MKKSGGGAEKEDKEKRKKEKKERKENKKRERGSMTAEELLRLDEVRRSLKIRGRRKEKEKLPSGITADYSASFFADLNRDEDGSCGGSRGENLTQSDSSEASLTSLNNPGTSHRMLPPLPPRPPKRGILKQAPRISNNTTGLSDNMNYNDNSLVMRNTLQNEVIAYQNIPKKSRSDLTVGGNDSVDQWRTSPGDSSSIGSGDHTHSSYLTPPVVVTNHDGKSPSIDSLTDSTTNSSFATPPFSLSPVGEGNGHNTFLGGSQEGPFNDLPLPPIEPICLPEPRELSIVRQPPPRNDFGFSLRRAMVVERDPEGGGGYRLTAVIFAEPGAIVQHRNDTGLLPGDRLLEVNKCKVDDKTREEVIEMIKSSGNYVVVKVQPVSELSELSRRSGVDGRTVALDDSNIRCGTLRRSGSRRFNQTTAKSEEQLASERCWLETERLWLTHRHGFTAVRVVSPSPCPETGKIRVRLEVLGEELLVDEDDLEKANPPKLDRAEDLSLLRYLNESSALHTLRQRYAANLIHTYAGDNLLIINPMAPFAIYSEKVGHMFRGCKSEDMPAHIYSIAQSAYRGVLASRRDHSIVFLGQSGSGKTTNYRHVLHYLALAAGSVNKVVTPEKLNAIWTLLEAFGNARTSLNANATRFTHIFNVDFDQSGMIASASIQILLSERWRVVRRPEGELSFHVVYRLLNGCEGYLRRELFLDHLTETNSFIGSIPRPEDRQKATGEFSRLCGAFIVIGVSDAEAKVIWSVLASILHLGAAGAVRGSNSSKWQFNNPSAAQRAAQLLGITSEELSQILFGQGAGTPTAPRTPFRTPSPTSTDSKASDPLNGMDALEGLAVGLYSEVFNAVGALINRCISAPVHTVSSLLLMDCPGIQNPVTMNPSQAAGFSDLCHNYLNERLHQLFYQSNIVIPRDRYNQEHIDVLECDEYDDPTVVGGLVSVLDRAQSTIVRSSQPDLRQMDRKGLLWILDEIAPNPSSTDAILIEKIFNTHSDRDGQTCIRKGPAPYQIILQHCQGTNPVLYSVEGWLKESRENPVIRSAATLLQESTKQEVAELFVVCRGAGISSSLGGSVAGIESLHSLRRASSIRRTTTAGTAAIKRKSVSLQVKFTADGIVETLRRTKLKFVFCFIPHFGAGFCESSASSPVSQIVSPPDTLINIPLLRIQLRGTHILNAVRLYKQGFPTFLPIGEFRRRFRLLAAPNEGEPPALDVQVTNPSSVTQERIAVEEMLMKLEVDSSSYRLGLSQVFFRAGVLPHLESQRDEKLTDRVIKFQASCRGYLARKRFAKLKVEQLAVRCIQRNVRKFLSVRDWPWWRLLVRVTPLLNVHRTEEELRAKTEELEALRNKYEKLEQERTQLKHENGKLEAKLSEITVDLAEEHSTATLATERLELETTERLRLEKELQDIQAEKKQLQENAERLEFELLCAHTGVTDENGVGESDGEDGEGGGAYKQRYERAVQELEFTRRRLQQQHQDDLEQLIGLKKQLEKKLSDAYEEVEEQRQVVSQWKRKVQKLNSETNDLRLLLEEQNSRNNLLEKKQRKFDAEFQLLTDELRQERANKERAMRERELALGDKYTMEQNLSAVKLELELKEQKVAALSKELDELTFGGNTEEDVALLKKTKHQLESKLKDQEEELDDLAGQVQLLEQAKLRLEMSIEQMRKENRRELSQRDEELEEVRCNAQKKVKALECQLESEHEERTLLLRERHEMERRLADYEERLRASRATDQETLQKLRRDLKRTKALLRDAQATIHQSKADTPNKAVIRMLKNQLEDAECARVAAVKSRQVAEAESRESTAALEEAVRIRSEAEDRIMTLTRECSQLQSQLDENEEELAEVLKKYRAAVTQLSTEQMSLQEQASRVAELETERASLKEQLAELSSRLENIEIHGDPTSSLTVKRLQLKTKELESKLELEQTTRSRMEVQIARLKETTERLQSECETLRAKEYSAQENARRSARTVREMRVEIANLTSKEQEGQVQKRDLEKKLEAAENELNGVRADLRLALQRIEDLQCAIQGELEEGEEANEGASDSEGESVTSEDSMDAFLANHTLHTASAASLSRGSLDSFRSAERSSSERLQVKKLNDPVTKDSSYA